MSEFEVRQATIEDSEVVLGFILELAVAMKAESSVSANLTDIQTSLFDSHTTTRAIICEQGNNAIGFAVYFYNYSTWLGKNGLYLEDLYVSPKYRGFGAGKSILRYLARLAVDSGCGRLEWCVHEWNDPAIRIYNSIGAKAQNELISYRLSGADLHSLASDAVLT